MAELAAYTNAPLFTTIATNVAQARGIRVVLDSSGTTSVADATVRGDFVTSQAIAASGVGAAFSAQAGSIVPMLAGGVIAVADAVYSAAAGKVTTTSTNAVLVGTAVLAASGDGVLCEVLLQNPL